MEKGNDELWTAFLVRRLEAEGIEVGRFEGFMENDYLASCYLDSNVNMTGINYLIGRFVRCNEEALNKASLSDLVSNLDVFESVQLWPTSEWGCLEFHFYGENQVRFDNEESDSGGYKLEGLLGKYEHDQRYTAEEVIDDLVALAKDPLSSTFTYARKVPIGEVSKTMTRIWTEIALYGATDEYMCKLDEFTSEIKKHYTEEEFTKADPKTPIHPQVAEAYSKLVEYHNSKARQNNHAEI